MYHRVCEVAALVEGAMEVVTIERKRWLLVWPTGGAPTAFRALCPHNESSLAEATFDGTRLTCPHHAWKFDGTSGACVSGQTCDPIKSAPVKIEDGGVWIDAPEKKKRAAAGA